MIFSKHILVEAVLSETTLSDVLNPEWESKTNREMDNEFYSDKTELFWEYADRFLGKLQSSSKDRLSQWCYNQGWPVESVRGIMNSINDITMAWVHHWLSDKYIYDIMLEDEMDSEDPQLMHKLAVIELSHLLFEKL